MITKTIILTTKRGQIVQDQRIKAREGWVDGVNLICERTGNQKARYWAKTSVRRIIPATRKVMGHLLVHLILYRLCLEKDMEHWLSNLFDEHSKIEAEWLFLDTSSPSTLSMGGDKHCLLVLEDSTDCAWSYFLKKIRTEGCNCINAYKNKVFNKLCKQEGVDIKFEYTAPKNQNKIVELRVSLQQCKIKYVP